MTVQQTVRELASYALSKKGAQLQFGGELTEDVARPRVELPGISWGNFFEVENQDSYQPVLEGTFAELPVYANRLVEHQVKCPAIRETKWMPRDGHVQMAVPLDAELPIAFLKSLIDEAYDLVWSKLDDGGRRKASILSVQPLSVQRRFCHCRITESNRRWQRSTGQMTCIIVSTRCSRTTDQFKWRTGSRTWTASQAITFSAATPFFSSSFPKNCCR